MSVGAADYQEALTHAGVKDVHVVHHQTTGSTNDDARALVQREDFKEASLLVVADEQTKGRGRGGNVWSSPPGSIYMTLSVPSVEARMLGVLPLGVGAAVASALRAAGASANVKWPNDVLIDGRKTVGILCESSLLGAAARVVIGIGINVETAGLDARLRASATSLEDHGVRVDRAALVARITSRIIGLIGEGADNASVVAEWKSLSVPWWGEEVSLIDGGVERCVTLLDVNPDGQLVIRDEAGVVRSLVSGEVRQLRVVGA